MQVRRSHERGHADHGWLDAYHTFSFAAHFDPRWMGFRGLRVLNQDRIQEGTGFGRHPHKDMEIVTVVLQGALRHGDSMGNDGVLVPGDVQRMRAGTGVVHSEVNGGEGTLELLQMWLPPRSTGRSPGYRQEHYAFPGDRLVAVVAPEDRPLDGALDIDADAWLHVGRLQGGAAFTQRFEHAPNGWLHVAKGSITVDGTQLGPGDGVGLEAVDSIDIAADQDAFVILWELA